MTTPDAGTRPSRKDASFHPIHAQTTEAGPKTPGDELPTVGEIFTEPPKPKTFAEQLADELAAYKAPTLAANLEEARAKFHIAPTDEVKPH